MKSRWKTSFNFFLIVLSVAAVMLVFFFLYHADSQTQIYNKIIVPFIFPEEVATSLPFRLEIPRIQVDAVVEYAGIASDGSMEVPKGGKNVAWYELGPRPGERGSAVMAGHYGPWKGGAGSVFDRLNELKKGDRVYVLDDKMATTTFIVREIRDYDPRADATFVFSSNDGLSHFNLITCEGVWNDYKKSYSNRLVVFTDKEL